MNADSDNDDLQKVKNLTDSEEESDSSENEKKSNSTYTSNEEHPIKKEDSD